MTTTEILDRAVALRPTLSLLTEEVKNRGLFAMADALLAAMDHILAANALDMEAARGTLSEVMLDRLMLNESRIAGMADGVRAVACALGRVRFLPGDMESKGVNALALDADLTL